MRTEQRITEVIAELIEALVAGDTAYVLTAEDAHKEPVLEDADFRTAVQVLRWVLEEDIRQGY